MKMTPIDENEFLYWDAVAVVAEPVVNNYLNKFTCI